MSVMATEKAETKTSSKSVVQSIEDQVVIEEQLITYLRNILKYQFVPMNFMHLRKLVKEAPQKLQLYKYIQEKYPGEEFLAFLQKFPSIFVVNPDKSVQVVGSSYFTQPQTESGCDEVDAHDRGEYISDEESPQSDNNNHSDSDT